jgi:2-polyprenyl-3-methyl-5-hydroxy-6-metoxy-1,4-benzoquinol methylase
LAGSGRAALVGYAPPVLARLLNPAYKLLAVAYYRWGFGHDSGFERWARPRVRRWERATARGDAPFDKDAWERQFRAGRWDYLPGERTRYQELAALLSRHLKAPPTAARILDVGCGEGPLVEPLRALGIRHYLGIDVAEAVIARTGALADSTTRFLATDAESFSSAERFDVVVFNESLYYFEDPLAGARRFAALLAPEGILCLSMFESRRSNAVVRELQNRFDTLEIRRIVPWRQLALRGR